MTRCASERREATERQRILTIGVIWAKINRRACRLARGTYLWPLASTFVTWVVVTGGMPGEMRRSAGVLLLSQFVGAALELTDAVLFNPFAIDEMAEAIHQAVEMPAAERKKRMQRMRSAVQNNNVYRWAGKILSALLKFDIPEVP